MSPSIQARRRFTPSALGSETLEARVVLSHGGIQASPVLLQGLHAPSRAFSSKKPAAASSLVQLAFQQFQQQYSSVRSTYLSAVQARTATPADYSTFVTYTAQQTNLLAEQVLNSLLVFTQSTSRGHSVASPLPTVVAKIDGSPRTGIPNQQQSLLANLIASTPAADASPTTVAVATTAGDNAIQAATISTLNSVTVIRNGNFGNGQSH